MSLGPAIVGRGSTLFPKESGFVFQANGNEVQIREVAPNPGHSRKEDLGSWEGAAARRNPLA